MNKKYPFILAASLLLAAFVIIVSVCGILIAGFYAKETLNWQAQCFGQDVVDLFVIVPCLIITGLFAYRGDDKAILLWGRVISYLIYTFLIYCFAVHFNRLFVLYCFTLGLSFYSLIYFFIICKNVEFKSSMLTKIIAIYFLIISTMFYFLWLSEVLPAAISNTIPQSLTETGLFTNPIHVIDLSLFLPALFITSVLLFKKKALGYLLIPVFLVFTILMNITIGALQLIMIKQGVGSGYSVMFVMTVLAIFSAILLFFNFKRWGFAENTNVLIKQ